MGFQLSQIMLHNLSWCIYGIIKAAIIKGPAIGNACFQIGRITDMRAFKYPDFAAVMAVIALHTPFMYTVA
ncbi:hypothetical protein D3C80_1565800 [compost metagenome]